jgi:DMSO/TMAO reductase YedYZ molybdopterin-dependent catalytic subunit
VKISWSRYARTSLVVYLALLAVGLTIFFHPPFDYKVTFNGPATEEPSFEELPNIESYEDLQKLVNMDPAEVDNSNLPITPVDALHTTIPERIDVDMASYTLVVDGLVSNQLELTYTDILAYPQISDVVLLICPGFFADNAEWTGVSVASLLAEAQTMPAATTVTFYGLDVSYDTYYRQTLPLDTVKQDGLVIAYQVNGQDLPPEHGYPLRLVVKGGKGFTWVKWLWRIEVS